MSTNDVILLVDFLLWLVLCAAYLGIQKYRNKMPSRTRFTVVAIIAAVLTATFYFYKTGWLSAVKGSYAEIVPAENAIATFQYDDALEIKLVAHEPVIQDPVFILFDQRNRIWVCEMTTFMLDELGTGQEQAQGKIVVLDDLDGDGVYENRKVVIDNVVLPRSIALVKGGILYADQQQLYYAKLDNDQLVKQTVVDANYAQGGNVEHKPNGLLYGMDHWYYNAKSESKYRFLNEHEAVPEGAEVMLRIEGGYFVKADSFHRGQWGISHDDYGRLFYIDNSTPLKGEYLFPDSSAFNSEQTIGDNTVFPIRTNYGANRAYSPGTLTEAGKLRTYTAASGAHIYRSGVLPSQYYGAGFSGEVASNTVVATKVIDTQGQFQGQRFSDESEFIASTDERFRPVSITSGPDGAMYIVDMHQGIVQDKFFITNYLQRYSKASSLQEGEHLGRLYRVASKKAGGTLPAKNNPSLLQQLFHANAWHRDFARRYIVQNAKLDLVDDITAVILDRALTWVDARANDIGKVNALWTLQGLSALNVTLLLDVYRHSNNDLQGTSVLLARTLDQQNQEDFLQGLSSVNQPLGFRAALELASLNAVHPLSDELVNSIGQHYPENDLIIELMNFKAAKLTEGVSAFDRLDGEFLASYQAGEKLYKGKAACFACHGIKGEGMLGAAPPLNQSEWVVKDAEVLIKILLKGLKGKISVNGVDYDTPMIMPGFAENSDINDKDIAAMANYVGNSWQNQADYISEADVAAVRDEFKNRQEVFAPDELSFKSATVKQTQTKLGSVKLASVKQGSIKLGLFNGKNFDGWHKVGGFGEYRIEGGAIVGTAHLSPLNTFLVSDKSYKDFELSLEFKVDDRMNSGIQFRSEVKYSTYLKGYQFEIDPSDRSWSGGVYHEMGGGWLFDLTDNQAARKAFIHEGWNKARIRVQGQHIQTWINGVVAVDDYDDSHSEGVIALQVHAILRSPENLPEVSWRNIQLLEL